MASFPSLLWLKCRTFSVDRILPFRCVRRPNRKGKAEHGPVALMAVAPNGAPVGGHDFTDDREPQPSAATPGLTGDAEELVEEVPQVLLRDAGPRARH